MAETQTYTDGQVIFHEGERSTKAYVIAQGRVVLTKQTPDGESIQVATLGEGELFGEMGVIDRGTRSATATASGEVTLEEVSRMDFRAQLETDNSLSMKVIENLVVRLRKTDELLVNLSAAQKVSSSGISQTTEQIVNADEKTSPTRSSRRSGRSSERERTRKGRKRRGEEASTEIVESTANSLTTVGQGDSFLAVPSLNAGFLNRLVGGIKNAMMAASENTIDIFIAPLHGDRDNWLRNMIISALSEIDGLNVRPFDQSIPDVDPTDVNAIRDIQSQVRPALQTGFGNLLIWGGIASDGNVAHLHMTPDNRLNNTLPGLFLPNHVFYLPSSAGEKAAPAIQAITLGALILQKRSHAQWLQTPLPEALKAAGKSGLPGLNTLPAAQQASTLVCIGNAMAVAGRIDSSENWLERAIRLYLDAAELTDKNQDFLYRSLTLSAGLSYHIVGEHKNNLNLLQKAEFYLEEAVEKHPYMSASDKAETTVRLGQIRYHIALLDSSEEATKQAMDDFKKSLGYFTRAQHPLRWAEQINSLAQCMQLFGTLTHNPEALERSVQLCIQALEVRQKQTYPLLWAASQNNMASALFLLSRHNGDAQYIKKAAELFEEVKEVYVSHGLKNQIALAEKNYRMATHELGDNKTTSNTELEWRLEMAKPIKTGWFEEEDV